jgi:hypothetical protein
MTSRAALLLSLAGSLLLAACGDSPGSGPVSEEDYRAGCERSCEHRQACGTLQDGVAACVASCVDEFPEAGWLRGDALEDVTVCQAELACDASGDQCFGACDPTGAHERYEAQCRETLSACTTNTNALDEICSVRPVAGASDSGLLCFIIPSIMDELTACLPAGTGCDAAGDCLDAVFERHHVEL